MPTFCGECQNLIDADRPKGYVLIERPCQCENPGTGSRGAWLLPRRVAPVDLYKPKDPDRRRLGLPAVTDRERSALPPEQIERYGGKA